MTSAGPWSVKGIDPKAREIAKDQARRSGQTLGEWLNTRIIDPEGEGGADPDTGFASPPGFYAPPPRARATAEIAPRPAAPRLAESRPPEPRPPELRPAEPRPEARRWVDARTDERLTQRAETSAADMRRVADALGELSSRIEAAEQSATLAIDGVDQQVAGVLARMQDLDHAQMELAAGFEGQLQDVRGVQAKLAERLRRMDEQDGPRLDAMKALEAALGRIAGQMHEGEARARAHAADTEGRLGTTEGRLAATEDRLGALGETLEAAAERAEAGADADLVEQRLTEIAERLDEAEARTSLAVRSLETSFTGLDRRMADLRRHPEDADAVLDQRFARLAADLSQQVEASRTEMVERLTALAAGTAGAQGRLDQVEPRFEAMAGQLAASEQRAAQAIDAMGREVVRIAQGLGGRVAATEARQVESEKRLGGEMARIADAMEARLRDNDASQADALEKLGDEIARIAEKLADRIASSERRAALSAEDLGEKFVRVTERLDTRQNETAAEIALRLHESEARTARLLAEAPKPPAAAEASSPVAAPDPAAAGPASVEAQAEPSWAESFWRKPSSPEPSLLAELPPVEAVAPPPVEAIAAPTTRSRDEGARDGGARDEASLDVFSAIAHDFLSAPEPRTSTLQPLAQDLALDLGPATETEPSDASTVRHGLHEPFPASVEPDFASTAFDDGPFGAPPLDPAAAPDAAIEPPPFTAGPFGVEVVEAHPEVAPASSEPAGSVSGASQRPFGEATAGPAPPRAAIAPPRLSSTRELIEQARAAARIASEAKVRGKGRGEARAEARGEPPPAPPNAPAAPSVAAPGFEGEAGGFGMAMPWRKKSQGGATLRTVVMSSVLASSVAATAVGVFLLVQNDGGRSLASGEAPTAAHPVSESPTGSETLAMAIAPSAETRDAPQVLKADLKSPGATPAAEASVGRGGDAAAQGLPRQAFEAGEAALNAGDASGVEGIRRAANLAYIPAQIALAHLYEDGRGGLPKNLVDARTWTERAAAQGDTHAMFNLGLFMANGEGGPRDPAAALVWFRRAADAGLPDAQYNLAIMNQNGEGAPRNLAEAYKWFLVAAGHNDAEARAGADRLKAQLTPDQAAAAQRAATALAGGIVQAQTQVQGRSPAPTPTPGQARGASRVGAD